MAGRNGADQFSRFLIIVVLILMVLYILVRGIVGTVFWVLAVVGLIYSYFRMFSRNIYKRQKENQFYLRQKNKITAVFRGRRERFRQRKEYKFYRCPNCKTLLRVPRGKGRIRVSCKKCGQAFEKKT